MPQIVYNIIAIGIGGAFGAILRYCVSLLVSGTHSVFNLGTIAVNLLGSLTIGILYVLMAKYEGGFTTFSSFALDSINIARNSGYPTAALYIAINNIGGIMAALAGIVITHYLTQAK